MSNIAEAQDAPNAIADVEAKVSVFPTVAEEFITVSIDESVDGATVSIVSSNGAVVFTSNIDSDTKIPVDYLAKGSYTVQISIDGVIVSKTVLVK